MMGSGMFEGLGSILAPGEHEYYTPGDNAGLALTLVKLLADETFMNFYSVVNREEFTQSITQSKNYIISLVEENSLKRLNGQKLLEDVLFWADNIIEPSRLWSLDFLLSPLIQALYELNHNDFVIDLSKLQGYEPGTSKLIISLKGAKERPLRLACKGDVDTFGMWLEYCDVELKGKAVDAAKGARYCTFTFTEAESLYKGLSCCEHRWFILRELPGMDPQPIPRGDYPESCTFYLRKGLGNLQRHGTILTEYRKHGNKLYIPKRFGKGWQKVGP